MVKYVFNPFTGNLDAVLTDDYVRSLVKPGGNNTEVQFNDNGEFNGISGWTTDGSSLTGTTDFSVNSTNFSPLFQIDVSDDKVWIGDDRTLANQGRFSMSFDPPADVNPGASGIAGYKGWNFYSQRGGNLYGDGTQFIGTAGAGGGGSFECNVGGSTFGSFVFIGLGGQGGGLTFDTGSGGTVNATSLGFGNSGGTAGALEFKTGNGGSATGTGGAMTGGRGGNIKFDAGSGGGASSGTTTNTGGQGGAIEFYGGKGGTASGTGATDGIPGNIDFWVRPTPTSTVRMFRMSGETSTVEMQFAPIQFWDNICMYFGTAKDSCIKYTGTNLSINPKEVGSGYVDILGQMRMGDKLFFTQTDGNEYIDSLADGYMDYGATTAHRFLANVKLTGDNRKILFGGGDDASIYYDGTNLNINPREVGTGNVVIPSGELLIGGTATGAQLYLQGTHTTTSGLGKLALLGTHSSSSTGQTNIFINQASVILTGATATNVYGLINLPTLGACTPTTLPNAYGTFSRVDTTVGFTKTITNAFCYGAGNSSKSGGTITNQFGYYVQNLTSGTNNWAYYNAGNAPNFMGLDASKTYFGTAGDSSIQYDGTDLNFNSQEVGSGDFNFLNGNANFDGTIKANQDETNNTGLNVKGNMVMSSDAQFKPQAIIRNYNDSVNGGYINFGKARGTIASPSNSSNGDQLGTFIGQAYYDGSFRNTSGFGFGVETNGTNPIGSIKFATNDGTGYSNRMLLYSSYTLFNSDDYQLRFGNAGDAGIYYDGTNLVIDAALVGSGTVVLKNLPTSASGLATGAVWNDSGVLKIV